MIESAAKAGCEYYVIDAGWYAKMHEDLSRTIGSLGGPPSSRWPHGSSVSSDKITQTEMKPGLWLEPEVAGVNSVLATQHPGTGSFVRHGRRVSKEMERYFARFSKSGRSALSEPSGRPACRHLLLAHIKMDYNVDSLQGTDAHADSVGQGAHWKHGRAYLAWIDQLLRSYIQTWCVENWVSGGGRMDYAQLSRFQIQSATDQEDYLRRRQL